MSHASLLLLGVVLAAGRDDAGEHMLAGARLFREGRFPEALVEFRVAEKLGARDARSYVGVALVKLDRPEEAIEAFGGVDAPGNDPLIDYYRALAAYGARLYIAAERLLAAQGDRAGPRRADSVAKLRARIAPVLAQEPTKAAIGWYSDRCEALRGAGRAALAGAYCGEAAALSARQPDRQGRPEAATNARSASPGGPP